MSVRNNTDLHSARQNAQANCYNQVPFETEDDQVTQIDFCTCLGFRVLYDGDDSIQVKAVGNQHEIQILLRQ